jgi:GT2 family glycosyltransferase
MSDERAGEPALHIVIVAYGSPDALALTLEALDGAHPVTVVDNSSSTETEKVVEAAHATYVDPGRNLGFAAGVNLGLAQLPPDHGDVLLLNPDARIWPAGLSQLRRALAEDPKAACVAPALHDPRNGQAERTCWPFPSPLQAWAEAIGLGRLYANCDFLIGAVLLLRREALAEVGRLDERYFLYAEEVDWQYRARAAGWHGRSCPEVDAEHLGAGTGGDPRWRQAMFHASVERFVRKWYGPLGWTSFRLASLVGAILRGTVRAGSRGRSERRRAVLYVRGPIKVSERTPRPGGAA